MTRTARLSALAFAFVVSGNAALAAPGAWTLGSVRFVGNSQVPTDELENALPIKPGERIDRAGLQTELDAIGEVYHSHNVGVNISQRLSARGDRATITYTLAEQAPAAPAAPAGIVADSVTVTGNKHVSTADILAAVNIQPGSQVTNAKLKAAQDAVAALYRKKNIGASVDMDFTNTSPQHVALVCKITENN